MWNHMEGFYTLLMCQVSAKFNLMNTLLLESYGRFLHTAGPPGVCKSKFYVHSVSTIIYKLCT